MPNLLLATLRGKLLFYLNEPLATDELLLEVFGGDLSRPIYAVFIPNLFTFLLTGDFIILLVVDVDLAVENPLLLTGTEAFLPFKVELIFML